MENFRLADGGCADLSNLYSRRNISQEGSILEIITAAYHHSKNTKHHITGARYVRHTARRGGNNLPWAILVVEKHAVPIKRNDAILQRKAGNQLSGGAIQAFVVGDFDIGCRLRLVSIGGHGGKAAITAIIIHQLGIDDGNFFMRIAERHNRLQKRA